MNFSWNKLIRIPATSLILVVLLALPSPVRPQNPAPADVRPAPVEVRIDPSLMRFKKRPPVPFKPFEMRDPRTGQAISPDTMLTLPNGKKMTAAAFYAELNKAEELANKLGETLRVPGETRIPSPVSVATLTRQTRALRGIHPPVSRFQPFDLAAVEREIATAPHTAPDITTNMPATPLHWTKTWSTPPLGDPAVFSAYVNGNIAIDGTKDLTTIHGEANAGGSMFSHSFDLLRVTSNLSAPRTGTMSARVAVLVAGVSVYNLNENVTTNFSRSDSLQRSVDKSVTLHFSLGPVPMSAKMGVQGSVGVSYGVAVAPIRASAHVGPFVHSNVYAQVGVDFGIAGAGAEANLTLVNYNGNLNGTVSIETDPHGPLYKWSDSYCEDLNLLSGKIDVYAYIDFWLYSHRWTWDIFDWAGYKTSGCLFMDSRSLYLYDRVLTTH